MADPLAEALRADPPDAVAALPLKVRTRLAGLVDAAHAHQRAATDEAVAAAIKGVPLPVRGVVKKALTG